MHYAGVPLSADWNTLNERFLELKGRERASRLSSLKRLISTLRTELSTRVLPSVPAEVKVNCSSEIMEFERLLRKWRSRLQQLEADQQVWERGDVPANEADSFYDALEAALESEVPGGWQILSNGNLALMRLNEAIGKIRVRTPGFDVKAASKNWTPATFPAEDLSPACEGITIDDVRFRVAIAEDPKRPFLVVPDDLALPHDDEPGLLRTRPGSATDPEWTPEVESTLTIAVDDTKLPAVLDIERALDDGITAIMGELAESPSTWMEDAITPRILKLIDRDEPYQYELDGVGVSALVGAFKQKGYHEQKTGDVCLVIDIFEGRGSRLHIAYLEAKKASLRSRRFRRIPMAQKHQLSGVAPLHLLLYDAVAPNRWEATVVPLSEYDAVRGRGAAAAASDIGVPLSYQIFRQYLLGLGTATTEDAVVAALESAKCWALYTRIVVRATERGLTKSAIEQYPAKFTRWFETNMERGFPPPGLYRARGR